MSVSEREQSTRWPRKPLLALLMHRPATGRLFALLMVVQFYLMHLGYSGWFCPILFATEIQCPGCGVSRSIMSLGAGELDQAFQYNAFGPLVAVAGVLLVLSGVLPRRAREALVRAIEQFETRTGLTHVLFAFFLVYWLVRVFAGLGETPVLV